jgi:hypothetical protein
MMSDSKKGTIITTDINKPSSDVDGKQNHESLHSSDNNRINESTATESGILTETLQEELSREEPSCAKGNNSLLWFNILVSLENKLQLGLLDKLRKIRSYHFEMNNLDLSQHSLANLKRSDLEQESRSLPSSPFNSPVRIKVNTLTITLMPGTPDDHSYLTKSAVFQQLKLLIEDIFNANELRVEIINC